MSDRAKGRRERKAEPGTPPPITLFNTLITVPNPLHSRLGEFTLALAAIRGAILGAMTTRPGTCRGAERSRVGIRLCLHVFSKPDADKGTRSGESNLETGFG
jgi:hypothetical protein